MRKWNKKSNTNRRVQPLLSHFFKYYWLSSASTSSENHQPLLFDNHGENVEQLKHEDEENRVENESLEGIDVILEKDMQEFRATIISENESSNMEDKIASLEEELLELKSIISKLLSTLSQAVTPGPTETRPESILLTTKVETLELRLMKVELDHLMVQRKQETTTGMQRDVELDTQLLEVIENYKLC